MSHEVIAICLGGLEEEVMDDIHQSLPDLIINILPQSRIQSTSCARATIHGKTVYRGDAGCGKLRITNVPNYDYICSIRSVQYWMLYVYESLNFPSASDAITTFIQSNLKDVDWKLFYLKWLSCVSPRYVINHASLLDGNRAPTFVVRVVRDGDHKMNSTDMAKTIGESIHLSTGWKVSLNQMDLEVVAIVLNETFYLGFNIPTESKPFLTSMLPREIRKPVINATNAPSLRPSTAYLMVKLTQPKVGDILVDGLTGSGPVMIEGAFSHRCLSLGGDIDCNVSRPLMDSFANIREMTRRNVLAEGLLWSAHRLPFHDSSVDIAIIDLPFLKGNKLIPRYYNPRPPKFVEEIARVLRCGVGRCLFLAQKYQQINSCLDSVYFHDMKTIPINVGGYVACFVIAHRTDKIYTKSNPEDDDEVKDPVENVTDDSTSSLGKRKLDAAVVISSDPTNNTR